MAASAALFAISEMFAGMSDPMALTCRPMIALKRIARLVRSSSRMARASAAWSSNESSDVSLGAFQSREQSAENSWMPRQGRRRKVLDEDPVLAFEGRVSVERGIKTAPRGWQSSHFIRWPVGPARGPLNQ
jgi:hypothetical protein